jgi:hypothetical protein
MKGRIPLPIACSLSLLATIAFARNDERLRDRDVLARAGDVVRTYEVELPRLVARETSVQRQRSEGVGGLGRVLERHLVAEFGWVAFPGSTDVVGVRDVVEVDGNRLTSERDRLQSLLHGSRAGAGAEVRRLLDEAARYNLDIAQGSRNLNLPTLVLFFLHPQTQPHFRWSRRSPTTDAVWEFEFKEREGPTIIHAGADQRERVISRGRVLIERTTGVVRRSELNLRFNGITYTLITIFERVAALNLVLPASLEERFETAANSVVGKATYDNYRRFETDARLLP